MNLPFIARIGSAGQELRVRRKVLRERAHNH
jgi:hypothetical protein